MTRSEKQSGRRIALVVVVMALVGLSIFGSLALRAIRVETVRSSEALARFTAARKRLANQTPMIEVDANGRVTRSEASKASGAAVSAVTRLEVLGYRATEEKLVEAHVPFWFFDLKGDAVQFAVRDTGMDLERLGLTAEDLSRHGPGLILDQLRPNGERLLIWTE